MRCPPIHQMVSDLINKFVAAGGDKEDVVIVSSEAVFAQFDEESEKALEYYREKYPNGMPDGGVFYGRVWHMDNEAPKDSLYTLSREDYKQKFPDVLKYGGLEGE